MTIHPGVQTGQMPEIKNTTNCSTRKVLHTGLELQCCYIVQTIDQEGVLRPVLIATDLFGSFSGTGSP